MLNDNLPLNFAGYLVAIKKSGLVLGSLQQNFFYPIPLLTFSFWLVTRIGDKWKPKFTLLYCVLPLAITKILAQLVILRHFTDSYYLNLKGFIMLIPLLIWTN